MEKRAISKKIPAYLDSAVIYQLFLRAFTPQGTLKAAEKMLPHLKDIGVDIVYLCPFFTADDDMDTAYWSGRQMECQLNNPKNPYRMQDYFHVDPEYGTDEDLHDFVNAAHATGLRGIFDLVYFHCGPTAVFLQEHPDFIRRNPDGSPRIGEWRFPELNFENPELREYMWSNMEYYVREYDVDGYRCDVADRVPLDFWEEGRRRIDAIKPELMMLNESWTPDMQCIAFDLNYDFGLSGAFQKVLKGEAPATHIRDYRRECERDHLAENGRSILCFDNHDYANGVKLDRFETRYGTAAVDTMLFLIYTMQGVPFLYNGYEVADANHHCIWGNRFHGANLTIEWENALIEKGRNRMQLVRELAALHKGHSEITKGDLQYAESSAESVLVFVRSYGAGRAAFLVNMSDKPVDVETDVTAHLTEQVYGRGTTVKIRDCKLCAHMEPYGFSMIQLLR